ncbi:MAG: trimethylamine methyltransferase family protein [Gammaproteobacteria bacterium]
MTKPQAMLKEYVAPPLDPGIDEALREYMDKRKASFADSSY